MDEVLDVVTVSVYNGADLIAEHHIGLQGFGLAGNQHRKLVDADSQAVAN